MFKKLLFIIALFSFPLSTYSAGIDLDTLKQKFPDANIQEYTFKNLEKDIKAPIGELGIYENSIQSLSKQPGWNKAIFNKFVTALKNKKTAEASKIYQNNWKKMSPFLPTCCAFGKYIAFKPLKNGILTLYAGWNGQVDYSLTYIFYSNGRIYSIQWAGYFIETIDDSNQTILVYKKNPEDYQDSGEILFSKPEWLKAFVFLPKMKSWFNNKTIIGDPSFRYFQYEYTKFIDLMTTIWQ